MCRVHLELAVGGKDRLISAEGQWTLFFRHGTGEQHQSTCEVVYVM